MVEVQQLTQLTRGRGSLRANHLAGGSDTKGSHCVLDEELDPL